MFKNKSQFKEDTKSNENENSIQIFKSRKNNHYDKNDSLENFSQDDEEIINPFRGRQLNNNNIYTIKKKFCNQNNSTIIAHDIIKQDIIKNEMNKKKTIKANSARLKNYSKESESNKKIQDQYFSVDSASEDSYNMNKKMKIIYKKKNYLKNENEKKVKNFQTFESKFVFDESKETDYNMQDDDSSGGLIYQLDDNSDTLEKMENLNIEIERILIDVYNNHIKSDKKVNSFDIAKYEKHITSLSVNLDKYNNLIILQIFEEKIKDLIEVRFIIKVNIIRDIKKKYLKFQI